VVAGLAYVLVTAGLLLASERDLTLVLLGAVVGNVVSIAVVMAWAARAPDGRHATRRGRDEYLEAVRFGLPAGAGELVLLAMLRVDVLIVAAFLPLRDVGLYAVATALAEVLWILPDGVAQVVLPTTARDPSSARTTQLLRLALLVTAGMAVVLVVVARPVIDIAFGTVYGDAASAVPLLALASIAGGAWKIVASEIVARGHTRPRLWSALTGLCAMVAVDLVAVPTLGIAGAALGSLCGYAVAAAVVVRAWAAEVHRPVLELIGVAP
jgi:O-antigen/teichoic acid export membrane protein